VQRIMTRRFGLLFLPDSPTARVRWSTGGSCPLSRAMPTEEVGEFLAWLENLAGLRSLEVVDGSTAAADDPHHVLPAG